MTPKENSIETSPGENFTPEPDDIKKRFMYSEFVIDDKNSDSCCFHRHGLFNWKVLKIAILFSFLFVSVATVFQFTVFSFQPLVDRYGTHKPFSDFHWWAPAFLTLLLTFAEIMCVYNLFVSGFASFFQEEWCITQNKRQEEINVTHKTSFLGRTRQNNWNLEDFKIEVQIIKDAVDAQLCIGMQLELMLNNYSLNFLGADDQTIFSIHCLSQDEAKWIQGIIVQKFCTPLKNDP